MEIFRVFKFDAAHRLPRLEPGHRCGRIHGHTFRVVVWLEGKVDGETGWIRDFGEIAKICRPVIDELDHSLLNDVPGLENPTSENLAVWLWNRLKPGLPELSMVEVNETGSSGCRYRGE